MAVFLSSEWRCLAMLNYRVPPELLAPYVPPGTTLDLFQGAAYASVVGLLFRNTRVMGVPIPFHRHFEEVNLRIYVQRETSNEVRHGVTFIRELVARRAVALAARLSYNEPYRRLPMRYHFGKIDPDGRPLSVEYAWRLNGEWSGLRCAPDGNSIVAQPGSEEDFITNHYWGYTKRRDGGTTEYEVRHPPWRVWSATQPMLVGGLSAVYGDAFARALDGPPHSAFFTTGSRVTVHTPTKLRLGRR